MTTGFDYSRLCVLLAVLEKRTGYNFGGYDVYINVIGGLKIDEPASDLAISLALYSGLRDIPIGDDVAVFGEVGLGGEIRAVSHIRERVREAARMGFEKCIVPKSSLKNLDKSENYGISIYGVANLQQAFKVLEMFTKESDIIKNPVEVIELTPVLNPTAAILPPYIASSELIMPLIESTAPVGQAVIH